MLNKRLDDLDQFIAKKLRGLNNSMDSEKINHQEKKQTNQNDAQINQNESAQTRLTTSAIAMASSSASSSAHSSSEGSNYSSDPVEYGPYRDNDAESLVSKKTATTQNDFSDDENHSAPILNDKNYTNNNNQDEDDDDLEVYQDEEGNENWYGDFQPNENNQSNSSDENSSYNIESTTNHQENQQRSSPVANTLITDEEPVGSSAYSRLTRTFRSYLNASNSVPIQNSQSSNENNLNDFNSNINLSLTSMLKSETSNTNLHNQENNFKRFESKTILFDKILNEVEISETNIIKSNNKLNKKSLSRIVNLFKAHENYYTTMIFPISDNFKIDDQNETINLINNKRMKHSYNEDLDGKQISNFSHDDDEISIYINNEKDLLIDSLFNLKTDSSLLSNNNSTTSSMANDKNDLSDTDCKISSKKFKLPLNEFHLCALCSHCLYDPITLVCGCSFCKNCLNEYNSNSSVSKETDLPAKGKILINSHKRKHNNGTLNEISMYKCYNCSSVHDHNSIDYLKQNVILSKIVDKFWQNNVNVRKLRNDLRRYVCFIIENHPEKVNFNKFELMFKKGLDLDPSNHLLLADLFIITYFDECNQKCLKYAQSVYDLRPNWPFSYFMKAIYYQKVGDLNQFKNNLIECLRLEPNIEQIRLKLYYLISKLNNENVSNNSLNQIINNIQINNDCLNSNETNSLNDSQESKKTQNLITDNKNFNQDKKTHSELNFDNSKYIIVNSHLVKPVELECSLCLRLLYNPVTTPCGHSFCASCLDRSLDHQDRCPLCKHSLADYLAERRQNVTLFLDELIKRFYVHEYEDRKKQSQEELKDLIGDENEVPVFVCTLGMPFVPCPLHIYEPRYRLMLRRAIETGSKQFGMCMYTEKTPHRYTEYGCMLDIKSCQFTRDGRAVVSTVGSRRFKVIHSATKDGYNVAKIEWVKDIKLESEFDKNELQQLHDEVYRLAQTWYNFLPEIQRNRIFGIYGINELPEPEKDIQTENGPIWHWILLSILPLESDFQYKFLTKTSLKERLIQMRKIILILLAPLRRMFMSNQNSSTDSSTPSSSIIVEASNSDSGTVTNSDNSNQNSANI